MQNAQQKTETMKNSYKMLEELVYGHLGTGYWRNVSFTRSGSMRLCAVAGWLTGLAHAGEIEQAKELAHDLLGVLEQQNNYYEVEYVHTAFGVEQRYEVPSQKVVISDDGTFNGFALAWYRPIHPNQWEKHYDKCRARISRENPDLEYWQSHEMAEGETRTHFKVRAKEEAMNSLDERKYFWPDDEQKKSLFGPESVTVRYGFSHIGGLLYHGPGRGRVFAVTIGDHRAWSIHT